MKKPKEVVITHNVEYNRIKNLIIAAYLLGQEDGLNKITYDSPISKRKRDNIIGFMMNGV